MASHNASSILPLQGKPQRTLDGNNWIVVRSSLFSSRRRHTISLCDWSSDVCSSDLTGDSVSAEPRHEVIMMIRNAIWPTRKSGEAIHWYASDAPADPSARHSTSLLHLHSPGVSSA